MVKLHDILGAAVDQGVSDIHLVAGLPPMFRLHGEMTPLKTAVELDAATTRELARQLASTEQFRRLEEVGEVDFAYSLEGRGRFRVNLFQQRNGFSAVMRLLAAKIPALESLGLPPALKELTTRHRGLVLVTGPTGSGKSTTLAAMLDLINSQRAGHIITLEDPIEYLHNPKRCVINQREIGRNSASFTTALRAALRQDPDVILVGEMRDLETISIAVTAAETGHLVFGTLHTSSAAQTIDRIIDVFPPFQQQQIRVQLAETLQGVVAQQLLPRIDRPGRIAAVEVMMVTAAVRNLIREGKTHQIPSAIQTGARFGMQSLDNALRRLLQQGVIDRQELAQRGAEPANLAD